MKEIYIIFISLQYEHGSRFFFSLCTEFKLHLIVREIASFQTETGTPVFLKSISGLKKDNLVKNE